MGGVGPRAEGVAHASKASRQAHDENDLFDLHQKGLATDGAAVDVV